MYRKSILAVILVLALVTMACSINVTLPEISVNNLKTGPTQTEDINVALPNSSPASLKFNFGAGKLNLSPGADNALVSGTATYNVTELKPQISTNGSNVVLQTGKMELNGIPNFSGDFKNEWDLKLGDFPIDLTINAGAYQGRYDFGGLSLQSLQVADGAADVEMNFSQPNKIEMSTLRYETGASNVKLNDLANANFSSMIFKSGAGDYSLDFSGSLQRDGSVEITSGVSHVTIIVPEGMPAQVSFTGGISNVNTAGNWQQSGSAYNHPGSGSGLTISVEMGAGSLDLETR
jgi:hypothetical protein